MPEENDAVALRIGSATVVYGDEVAVTAMEMIAAGDKTRLDIADLPCALATLAPTSGTDLELEAMFVFGTDQTLTGGAPEVQSLGSDGAVAGVVSRLDSTEQARLVVEATIAAWRQRLADMDDLLPAPSAAALESIGRLDMPGRPTLTQLHAERRRALRERAHSLPEASPAIDALITDLQKSVRFGASGVAAAADEQLVATVRAGCKAGEWLDSLRILVVAQEIQAIEMILGHERSLDDYAGVRSGSAALVSVLSDVCTRFADVQPTTVQKLTRRAYLRDAAEIQALCVGYASLTPSPVAGPAETMSWQESLNALVAMDSAADGQLVVVGESIDDVPIDEAAELLGELFRDALPGARVLVDRTRNANPGDDDEAIVKKLKRHALEELRVRRTDLDGEAALFQQVATLTMGIATVRGMEPRDQQEFAALGRRIFERAERIAKVQVVTERRVAPAIGLAAPYMRVIQRVAVESLFRALGEIKPAKSSPMHGVYKSARSKTWRARHDPEVGEAAASVASSAALKAVDIAMPWLIVRHIDRSLRRER